MDGPNSLPSAQTLPDCGPGDALFTVFVGDDFKRAFESAQEFAGRKEEVRIAGTAEAFVALTKGFEDQHAPRRKACDEVRKVRPVEIIRDDDAVEAIRRKRPTPRLEIGCEDFKTGRVRQTARIDISSDDHMPHRVERTGMAAMACGHI